MTGNRTLIVYATKGGVTEESASEIANILRDKFRLEVDLVDLKKNPSPDLEKYRNIILGSGVRMQKVYKEFVKFLEKDLKDKRVAIFLSSLWPRDEAITKYIKPVLEKHSHVKPISTEVFGGRMKVLWKTVQDKRDMKKVRTWAEKVGKEFRG